MYTVGKGTVNSIENNKCRVNKAIGGTITRPFQVPNHIDIDSLIVGQEVAFIEFEDNTGILLASF